MAERKKKQETLKRNGNESTEIVKVLQVEPSSDDSPGLKKLKHNFNHRIEAIGKLRKQFDELPRILSDLQIAYTKHIKPTETQWLAQKQILIETMHVAYNKKSFTENEKDQIHSLLLDELNELTENGHTYDEKFQQYFEMNTPEDTEMLQEMLRNMLGFDVDVNDVAGKNKLSPEEFAKKYGKEMQERAERIENDFKDLNRGGNSKRAKQKDDEMLDLDQHFMKTYKELAKKIHPDLEQDPAKRKEKEHLMKELAHAKDKKDLFQLISIKIKVERMEDTQVMIDENYLRLYADRLLEQKNELEMDIYRLKNHSGWNSWLYQNFYARHSKTTINKMGRYKKDLEEEIQGTEDLLKEIKTVRGMKNYLLDCRLKQDEEDIFFDFW